jgi:hypothetical protein
MINFRPKYSGLEGRDNFSGTKQRLYLAREDFFQTIANLDNPPDGTTLNPFNPNDDVGMVTVTANHTFVTGRGWIELYMTRDTSSVVMDMQEEFDRTGGNINVEFFHPGLRKEIAAFFRKSNAYNWIGLVETLDGKFLQLGRKDLWASVRAGFTTGTLTGDRRGFNGMLTTYDGGLIFYEGIITPYPS